MLPSVFILRSSKVKVQITEAWVITVGLNIAPNRAHKESELYTFPDFFSCLYQTVLFPQSPVLIPVVYFLFTFCLLVFPLVMKPMDTAIGMVIILSTACPYYVVFVWCTKRPKWFTSRIGMLFGSHHNLFINMQLICR